MDAKNTQLDEELALEEILDTEITETYADDPGLPFPEIGQEPPPDGIVC